MASHQTFVLNALDFFPHHKNYGHENLEVFPANFFSRLMNSEEQSLHCHQKDQPSPYVICITLVLKDFIQVFLCPLHALASTE